MDSIGIVNGSQKKGGPDGGGGWGSDDEQLNSITGIG